MNEFNTIEKVQELFRNIDGLGNDNLFFIACQDKQKVSGVAAGMEYPYDGLLINACERGIYMFYLKAASGLSGLFTLSNPAKMSVQKDKYVFIPTNNIRSIIVKNFALLNSKKKRIEINTLDGKSHKLYCKVDETDFPYHKDNFISFTEKYSNK